MLTDIEIAQQAEMEPIKNVAAKLGMSEDDICLLYTSPSPRDRG